MFWTSGSQTVVRGMRDGSGNVCRESKQLKSVEVLLLWQTSSQIMGFILKNVFKFFILIDFFLQN